MNQLTLSFLGAFKALLNGLPLINFRSAKVQGLLIYLVLTRQHAHERAVLATLFWPDEPERVANQNLRQSLYRLRQLLGDIESATESLQQTQGEPFLLVTRTTVQFNAASHFTLDVAAYLSRVEARQLEQAVVLYRGDLLPGFTCDSLPFDEWLRQEREPLHRLALDALFELTADGLMSGDHHIAQRLARQQLSLEPWREEAHRQLMQALALSGERSAALAQYELCRRVLLEELGIEPAPETQTLLARIRDQQIEPHAHHRSDGAHAQQRLVTPFVGRQREFERLVDAYRQASRNTLQVVALLGNTGIGKSRLAQQFLAWVATQEADVLYGRSFTTSTGISYQPITHLLRQRLERENAPEDLLSDLWLSQLTRLLPELRERYPDLPQPTQEENTAREHLFEAVTRLIQALAARNPLVLFVDDWHWADAGSLDLLHYAAVRWSEAKLPILLILTLRQEAASE
ncbi:MAG: AAA family ATPase, partial [Caldilineaceae bacterium]|nr:AAA family ATPase [Caldilineaceae bacterium]